MQPSSTPLSYNRKICSTNPSTGKVSREFPFATHDELKALIQKGHKGFQQMKQNPQSDRKAKILKVAQLIERDAQIIAQTMASQMGQPISQGVLELQRCATDTKYYANNMEQLLSAREVKTEATHSFYTPEPLGIIYIIVPFNWPAILSLRGIIPNLTLGNAVLLRFADSTPEFGLLIEKIFIEAGFSDGEFQNVFSAPGDLDLILSNPFIKGVIFTGSTQVGSIIASTAGKNLKRSVVELGGSDPVIILPDADVEKAADLTLVCRIRNAGQTCIAGQRFIVHESFYDKYLELVQKRLQNYVLGDPLLKETQMGPLARIDILESIHSQVTHAVEKEGAKLIYGGKRYEKLGSEYQKGYFYYPTLIECTPESILFREEVFGPVIAVTKYQTEEEAIKIANNTEFGLGSVIITEDQKHAQEVAKQIESGMVYINTFVRGDPRLPFSGQKNSGIGRSYHELGLFEFANIKTVYNN